MLLYYNIIQFRHEILMIYRLVEHKYFLLRRAILVRYELNATSILHFGGTNRSKRLIIYENDEMANWLCSYHTKISRHESDKINSFVLIDILHALKFDAET